MALAHFVCFPVFPLCRPSCISSIGAFFPSAGHSPITTASYSSSRRLHRSAVQIRPPIGPADRPASIRSVHSTPICVRDHTPHALPSFHPALHLRLESEEQAEELLRNLYKPERDLLYKVLRKHHKKINGGIEVEDETFDVASSPITADQTKLLFLCNCLPFIGFGVLDNLIMILAGEYIDSTMGIIFGLSTMAAAGFGNIASDIAGVGLAHYVEYFVAKFFNVRPPPLNAEQWDSSKARWTSNFGRAFGLTVGCLIGMFPLLFFDESEKQERKLKAKQQQE